MEQYLLLHNVTMTDFLIFIILGIFNIFFLVFVWIKAIKIYKMEKMYNEHHNAITWVGAISYTAVVTPFLLMGIWHLINMIIYLS